MTTRGRSLEVSDRNWCVQTAAAKAGKVQYVSEEQQELLGTNECGRKIPNPNLFSFYLKGPFE